MTDNKVPETEEPRLGLNEAMYHAQVVVDSFAKGLQERQCMSRIPIAIYTEAEMYEDRLIDTLSYLGEDETSDPFLTPTQRYTYTAPNSTNLDASEVQDSTPRNSSLEPQSQYRRWSDDCYDCDSEVPELDLDQIFGSILYRIDEFISQVRNLLNLYLPNFCQFSYLLSYSCIPDLVAILAIILAAILKLISSIFLGTFSILSFILGIVQMIIGQLLRYVLAMVRYALKPITCLLDTLAEIANNIPTQESLERRLSEDEYELLYGEKSSGEARDLPSAVSDMKRVMNGVSSDIEDSIKEVFTSISSTVEGAAESVDDSIEDLFGLVSYLECEPGRSGVSVFGKIKEIVNLVQVSNIIMAIIDKKASGIARDELCREKDEEYSFNNTEIDPDISSTSETVDSPEELGFTPLEIAEVIQTAIGVDTSLVVEEGTDLAVGLLIKKEQEYQTTLNMFSCNLPDVIKDYNLNPIIDRAKIIADEDLFGKPDGEPRTLNVEKVTVSTAEEFFNNDDFQFLPLDISTDENSGTSINGIIRDLIGKKTLAVKEKIKEKETSGIKEADLIPSKEDYSLGILVDGSIPASVFENKTILKCGSISNIKEQFLSLGEK